MQPPRKALTSLIAEAKKCVPRWVAVEVVKEYGIKKGEITGKKIGKAPQGDSFKEARFIRSRKYRFPVVGIH